MSGYFYHIIFELTSQLGNNDDDSSELPIFLPDTATDLFTSCLPIHSTSNLSSEEADGPRHHKRSFTGASDVAQTRDKLGNLTGKSSGQAELGTNQRKEGHRLRTGTRTQKWPADEDWRFDLISIQSIDMVDQEAQPRPRGKSQGQTTDNITVAASSLATRGRFIPSDPNSTNVGWGVVHLYRDAYPASVSYDSPALNKPPLDTDLASSFKQDECTTLCIVAVPSYMTPSDLLGFVGEQAREEVSHFRLVRTGRANKYMVLMRFHDAKMAKKFREEYNGRPFNSMDSEYCHVVAVASITLDTANGLPATAQASAQTSFPNMSNDPFTPAKQQQSAGQTSSIVTAPAGSKTLNVSAKPLAPPTPNLVELPTCPVCLERMDETTGLLTILCQHVFHCSCLEKWRGSGCPVCRYTQNNSTGIRRTTSNGNDPTSTSDDEESFCSVCNSGSNIWICLICGNLGCGRYDEAHAFAHFEQSGHSYAMDITTQHVWDYVGDGYVHRLITNKADGQIVDLPSAVNGSSKLSEKEDRTGGMIGYGADMVPREKMDAMGNEYAYLLTSQLDSQRRYFEEQLERAVDKASKATTTADKANSSLESLSTALATLQATFTAAQLQISTLEKESERSNRKAEAAATLARKFTRDYEAEKTMNSSLMERIRFNDRAREEFEEKLRVLGEEKADLEEQNRDLSFFISGQAKLKELEAEGEEVVNAMVEVPVAREGSGKRKKGRKK